MRARAARAAAGGTRGGSVRRMSAAKRKALIREELQELERMDKEMRGLERLRRLQMGREEDISTQKK